VFVYPTSDQQRRGDSLAKDNPNDIGMTRRAFDKAKFPNHNVVNDGIKTMQCLP